MGLLGLSLIFASVVYVIIRPPPWLPPAILSWLPRAAGSPTSKITDWRKSKKPPPSSPPAPPPPTSTPTIPEPRDAPGRAAMPPPPIMVVQPPPSVTVEPDQDEQQQQQQPQQQQPESPTTPKANPAQPSRSMPPPPPPPPPPSFSLTTDSMPPPPRPTPSLSSSSAMPPPPPPPSSSSRPRPPTLSQFPAANSAQRAARGPLPARGASGPGLAPPPTHTGAPPAKPSRQVTLDPGHSPLDWARLSGNGGADLRGLPAGTPYLRVTPSALRRQTGRRGTDAWMALGGRVYNVTPYARFHPGGVGELLRGAGRDATRLFAEVHPWVNYENMLAACLVGILVEEPPAGEGGVDGGAGAGARPESEMEAMD